MGLFNSINIDYADDCATNYIDLYGVSDDQTHYNGSVLHASKCNWAPQRYLRTGLHPIGLWVYSIETSDINISHKALQVSRAERIFAHYETDANRYAS